MEEEVEPGQPDKVIGDGQLEESLHHRHHLLVGEGQQGVDRGGDDPLLDQGQHQLGANRHLQQPAEQEAEKLFMVRLTLTTEMRFTYNFRILSIFGKFSS